eukprot:TRINITY_DN3227_c0_g2_i1.p1 TRINITY_DN3227_c0_g2~~TRINITY_DN3227_c0_g2_i1.p1  ORF type:complete len:309 (+),score=56.02 TRINITY_DN3227_c0_g2_i1:211-1137(+)
MAGLAEVWNALHIGNYSQVVTDASVIKADPYKKAAENEEMLLDRDAALYRAYIGQGQFDLVISDLSKQSKPDLTALCVLAQYAKKAGQSSTPVSPEEAIGKLSALPQSAVVAFVKGNVLVRAGHLLEARAAVAGWISDQGDAPITTRSLELRALLADILCRLYRPEAAEAVVEKMQAAGFDDHIVTLLAAANVHLTKGRDGADAAMLLYQDIADRTGRTPVLLNSLAVCSMARGDWQQAESHLMAASARENAPETVANLAVVAMHLHRPHDQVQRYLTQLKGTWPDHPAVQRLQQLEESFSRDSAAFS